MAKDQNFNVKTISITMVKNEDDIIESFVRHNLNFVDMMIIADNMSTDNTLKILTNIREEGLPIEIKIDDKQDYSQGDKISKLYWHAANNYAFSKVFFLDADEFLVENQPQSSFDGHPGEVYTLNRFNYDIIDLQNAEKDIVKKIVHIGKQVTSKSMLFHSPSAYHHYHIGMGSHKIRYHKKIIDNGIHPGFWIAHFPWRSKKQFLSKSILGYLAVLLASPTPEFGIHWQNAFEFICSKQMDLSDDDFLNYVYKYRLSPNWMDKLRHEPLPCSYVMKYQDLISTTNLLFSVVAAYVKTISTYWDMRNN